MYSQYIRAFTKINTWKYHGKTITWVTNNPQWLHKVQINLAKPLTNGKNMGITTCRVTTGSNTKKLQQHLTEQNTFLKNPGNTDSS